MKLPGSCHVVRNWRPSLAAKYRFEQAAPEEQVELRAQLEVLLKQALSEANISSMTVRQLEDSLRDVYREFVRVKRRAERERLSRIR